MRPLLALALFLTACGGSDFTTGFSPLEGGPGGSSEASPEASQAGQGGSSGADGGQAGSSTGGGSAGEAGSAGAPSCFKIDVQSAVWGQNCGAPTPLSSVSVQCEDKNDCTYTMDVNADPGFDPASGCWKDIDISYDCVSDSGVVAQKSAHAEKTWTGTHVLLWCCPP